jgi:hypothetical protein
MPRKHSDRASQIVVEKTMQFSSRCAARVCTFVGVHEIAMVALTLGLMFRVHAGSRRPEPQARDVRDSFGMGDNRFLMPHTVKIEIGLFGFATCILRHCRNSHCLIVAVATRRNSVAGAIVQRLLARLTPISQPVYSTSSEHSRSHLGP